MTSQGRSKLGVRGAALLAAASAVIFLGSSQWGGEAFSRLLGMPKGFESLAPVPNDELAQMRGGMVLPNGMVLNFTLEFRTVQNGSVINQQTFTEVSPELLGATGVINKVSVNENGSAVAAAEPTSLISGLMNQVQNDASGINLQHLTTLSADLSNTGFASEALRARSLSSQATSSAILSLGR